jgi:hypothetical protein
MSDDVLLDADTIRSPDLRHAIPAGVVDPFLGLACDRFEAEGFATQRKPGATVMDGCERLSGVPTSLQ